VNSSALAPSPVLVRVEEHAWRERELLQAKRNLVTLAKLFARERVAAFFLQMSQRIGVKGEIQLPMKHDDISNDLGLVRR
jgi:CRP-like cAMP-binding protein